MKNIVSVIEELRMKLEKYRKEDLKEYPTRTIFIDPLLHALGWDVRDPDEVELEYPTIDGKSVDYAPKVNRRPVLFIEAKPLNDPLTDVKAITQVVGYAANAGVVWCILTNGVTYKVYRSTEKAEAPDKLLFEVSIDPKESEGRSVEEVAEQFSRFSRDAMARGLLDEIGEQVFTTGKVRKTLDRLFLDPPLRLIRMIRSAMGDQSVKPIQIKAALRRIWGQPAEAESVMRESALDRAEKRAPRRPEKRPKQDYGEEHHTKGIPQEIVELYRGVDRFCREMDPSVRKRYLAKYIAYECGNRIFGSVELWKGRVKVWLKLDYSELDNPPSNIRDVSGVGHWGVGNVEVRIADQHALQSAKPYIRQSFEKNK